METQLSIEGFMELFEQLRRLCLRHNCRRTRDARNASPDTSGGWKEKVSIFTSLTHESVGATLPGRAELIFVLGKHADRRQGPKKEASSFSFYKGLLF